MQLVQKTLWELGEMEKLAAPSMALSELSDDWLADLMIFLLENQCILEVLRLLVVMAADSRQIPESLKAFNTEGRSFYTQWLPQYYSGCLMKRNNAGTAYLSIPDITPESIVSQSLLSEAGKSFNNLHSSLFSIY